MSKSYDNTIALFGSRALLQKQIASIVTDSRAPGEPKETEGSALYQIYQAFASPEEAAGLRQAFAQGIGWGEAKERLFERLDAELAPMRTRYESLMADPAAIETTLLAGALKARALVAPLMNRLRHAVGLRRLQVDGKGGAAPTVGETRIAEIRIAPPVFKQYRERDGKFYFKLVGPQGRVLMQSRAFDSPKDAGEVVAAFQVQGAAALPARQAQLEEIPAGQAAELAAALDRLLVGD
jgi:tryptophanyl-tRNA synthetase